MAITPLPPAPSRGSNPEQFVTQADAFLGALPRLVNEVNTEAQAIANHAASAEASAIAADAVAGAERWVSGTTYPQFAAVVSPTDFQVYRKRTTGGSTNVDPASDATNWAMNSPPAPSIRYADYGVSSVHGFTAINPPLLDNSNANSELVLRAKKICLANVNNEIHVIRNPPSVTLSFINNGVNGKRSGLAMEPFSSTFIYYIWNGTTLASFATDKNPDQIQPSDLPSGYTHWAFATLFYRPAGSTLSTYNFSADGSRVYCFGPSLASVDIPAPNISPGQYFSVNLSSIPTYVKSFFIHVEIRLTPSGTPGGYGIPMRLIADNTPDNTGRVIIPFSITAANHSTADHLVIEIPYRNRIQLDAMGMSSGHRRQVDVAMRGFTVFNGDN